MDIHDDNNYTLNGFEKLAEGTSCTVYRGVFQGVDAVLKRYKITDRALWNRLISENKRIRFKLAGHVRVPKILGVGVQPDFFIVEEYLGTSLKEYFSTDNWDYGLVEDLKDCIDIISELPEDIPLDTRPENFVITKFGFISFVDFMPPDPWGFLKENPELRKPFEEAFPQVVGALEREEVRKKRYYLNKYRIIKLLHYLDIKQ